MPGRLGFSEMHRALSDRIIRTTMADTTMSAIFRMSETLSCVSIAITQDYEVALTRNTMFLHVKKCQYV